jgi:hypothetical protein
MKWPGHIAFWSATLASGVLYMWLALTPKAPLPKTYRTYDPAFIQEKWQQVKIDPDSLRVGDLIVRSGMSFFSNELRKFNQRDQTYSHCGWVTRDNSGEVKVIHAIGGTDNPDNRMKMDKLHTFCHPAEAQRFAVFRYALPSAQLGIADSMAHALYNIGVTFDLRFDLEDDNSLYCAELIYKLLVAVTHNPDFINLSRINDKVYVGVDDLYLTSHCTKIYEHAYY